MQGNLRSYKIAKIGLAHGVPRIWIQGKHPASAGFLPGQPFVVDVKRDRRAVILRLSSEGKRAVVRGEKNGREFPIIDINSVETLSVFEGLDRVRVIASDNVIYILPLATDERKLERVERLKRKLNAKEPLAVGSLSHGGGVLSLAVHEGMAEAGLETRLVFANDIREELLEHASVNNPAWDDDTIALATPMQELAFDTRTMESLPAIDIFEAGLPCQGASLSGRAKKGTPCAEAHEEVGHLCAAFLAILSRVNPSIVIFENVEPYTNTGSAYIIRNHLREQGYVIHETILDGKDWNVLEHRRRMCLVAVTEGIEFDLAALQIPEPIPLQLGDVLEDIPLDATCWSEMGYLKDKAVRDAEAGKGFAMQIADATAVKVGTIGKGYAKNRSTEVKVVHPLMPNLLRLLTPIEHARVKGIWEGLIASMSATMAHEVLGQAILPGPFRAVARLIGEAIVRWWQSLSNNVFELQAA